MAANVERRTGYLAATYITRAICRRRNGRNNYASIYGDIEYVYLAEAEKARKTKDIDTFWQWISLTELPAHSLAAMKVWYGANFIRGTGFDTTEADEVYGADWLER